MRLISEAQQLPATEYPQPLPQPLTIPQANQLKKLQRLAKQQAVELQIAPEIMIKKKCLEELLRSGLDSGNYQLPDCLTGWRREYLGELLINYLQE